LDPKTWSDGVVKIVLIFALGLVIVESGIQPVGVSAASQAAASQAAPATRPVSKEPEARSLFGDPLYSPDPPAASKARLEADLAKAQAAYDQTHSLDNTIWLGRRLAYLGRFRDAIDVYTKGIEQHPKAPALYRHRGHRYVTVREFDKAIADLDKAAGLIKGTPDVVEQDGAPNAKNIPRSTLQSNIWYHLALAHYLKADYEKARVAYLEGMKVSAVNDDMLVATTDWLYMTYRRMGREAEAKSLLEPIKEQMDIIENTAYHKRLLMYKGLVKPEELLGGAIGGSTLAEGVQLATQGYGVANWYLYNGEKDKARAVFEKMLKGGSWAAFGYIAAEADMKRGF
jgi:tetratricopeptide (TPR) repeat protein